MRRKYESPVFMAEAYTFNDTIARTCDYKVDQNTVLEIDGDDSLCPVGDKGHTLGGNQDKSGNVVSWDFDGKLPAGATISLFNSNEGCQYKWAGPGTSVTKNGVDYGPFAQAIFGTSSSESGHAPAYDAEIFFS